MARKALGIGLAIGDEVACAAGYGGETGEWLVRQPALVSATSPVARVELLLAGDEVRAAAMEPLLQHPRRWRYVPGDPVVARELLTALLATLRQEVSPSALDAARCPPVLALPHTVSAAAAAVVQDAARSAGWGAVEVVSELAAQAALKPGNGEQTVEAAEGGWMHQGVFRADTADTLTLLRLSAAPLPPRQGANPPCTETLAQGAARVASGVSIRVDAAIPLHIGLISGQEQVIFLAEAGKPGTVIRALEPPTAAGVSLQLVAGTPESSYRTCQVLGEAVLLPARRPEPPWLLRLRIAEGLQGDWAVRDGSGSVVEQAPFRIRLP